MSSPLVSVCVITYEHANYIAQALDSILMQQTEFPIEICIGEDGSTDGTREICQEYAAKHHDVIRLFLRDRTAPARQQYSAPFMHNFVETIKSCRAKHIALCDGDDYWTDPLKLQKQTNFLQTHHEYSLCFHRSQVLRDGVLELSPLIVPSQSTTLSDLLENPVYIHTHSVVYRNVFGWDEVLNSANTQDYIVFVLAGEHGKLWCMDEAMGVYRIGENNSWLNKDTLTRMEDFIATQDALIEYFRKHSKTEVVSAIEKSQEMRLSNICKMHYKNGDIDNLRKYATKLVAISPSYYYDYLERTTENMKQNMQFSDLMKIKLRLTKAGRMYGLMKRKLFN